MTLSKLMMLLSLFSVLAVDTASGYTDIPNFLRVSCLGFRKTDLKQLSSSKGKAYVATRAFELDAEGFRFEKGERLRVWFIDRHAILRRVGRRTKGLRLEHYTAGGVKFIDKNSGTVVYAKDAVVHPQKIELVVDENPRYTLDYTRKPLDYAKGTAGVGFLRAALTGFNHSLLPKLQNGQIMEFKAARSFKMKEKGFSFRKGDKLSVRMTKKAELILFSKSKKPWSILLRRYKRQSLTIEEEGTGISHHGNAIVYRQKIIFMSH